MIILKMIFYFYILSRLYISIIILNHWSIKFNLLLEKKKNTQTYYTTLIFELNQMNSEKIMDGRVGFVV